MFDFKKNEVWAKNLQITMQIGLTMAGCIMFCFFLGRWVDGLFSTGGVFMVIFTILGVVGGANTVYRQIIEITEKDSDGSS